MTYYLKKKKIKMETARTFGDKKSINDIGLFFSVN